MKFIDIHSHIIFGVDDGSESIEMSMQMLRAAYKDNIGKIILTPHNKPGHHNVSRRGMLDRIEQMRLYMEKEQIDIELFCGNELYYRNDLTEEMGEEKCIVMADSAYVLVEFNPMENYDYIRNGIYQMLAGGYRPILAHVERYDCMTEKKEHIEELIRMGCYIQVNAGSIQGEFGYRTKHFSRRLLKDDLIHFVATDAHNNEKRGPYLKACAKYISKKFGEDYMKLLLHDNPAHIIADEPI